RSTRDWSSDVCSSDLYDKRFDKRVRQSGIECHPSLSAIGALKHAAGRGHIDRLRVRGVDGKRQRSILRAGFRKAGVNGIPVLSPIRTLKEAGEIGPRIEDTHVRRVNRKSQRILGAQLASAPRLSTSS